MTSLFAPGIGIPAPLVDPSVLAIVLPTVLPVVLPTILPDILPDILPPLVVPIVEATFKVAQIIITQSAAAVSTTINTPGDDSIPQSSEMTAVPALNTSITPTNAGSGLLIEADIQISCSTNTGVRVAIFRDSGVNALVCVIPKPAASNAMMPVHLTVRVDAGSLMPTTFKLMMGSNGTATAYINSASGTALFGGVMLSALKITEILP